MVGSVVTVALNLLFTEPAALGIDAAEWVECKQGEALARLPSGERHPSSEALRPWDDDGKAGRACVRPRAARPCERKGGPGPHLRGGVTIVAGR